MMAAAGAETVYGKLYRGRGRAAAIEERWLVRLPALGIKAARPIARMGGTDRALLVLEAAPGRSLDAWMVDAARAGWLADCWRYVVAEVAPFVRALHGAGVIHRDLNAAHLFTPDPRTAGAPTVIDVERMFRPRFRRWRWVVKDLASLLASSPVPVPATVAMRFLRNCAQGATRAERRRLAIAIARKAARVAAHRPRYG